MSTTQYKGKLWLNTRSNTTANVTSLIKQTIRAESLIEAYDFFYSLEACVRQAARD